MMIHTRLTTLVKRQTNLLFFVFLALLIFALYQRALFVYFLSDDFAILGKFLERDTPYFSFSHYFRPIPLINLWLDTQLFGLLPWLFRLENLLLHTTNAFLVYRFALLVLDDTTLAGEKQKLACLSGTLFAVLACHSEAVIWISCRPDLLATLFSLICMISYLKWLKSHSNAQLTVYLLSFFSALLSKESAFALPLLLIAITCFYENPLSILKNSKKYALIIFISVTALITYFTVRHAVIGDWFGAENISTTITQCFINLMQYSYRALFFPTNTATDTDALAQYLPFISLSILSILLMTSMKLTAAIKKMLAVLLVAYVVSLIPVMHKTLSLSSLQMERYLYLPSVFLCIFIPLFLTQILKKTTAYILMSLYIGFMIFSLNSSIDRWITAGNIAFKSLEEIRSHFYSEKLIVMGLPISVNGVHVFKNGFPRAVMFFNQTKIRRKYIYVPVFLDINENNFKPQLTQDSKTFHLSTDSLVSTISPGEDLGAYDVKQEGVNAVSLSYPDMDKKDYQMMVYCSGQLRFTENCKP